MANGINRFNAPGTPGGEKLLEAFQQPTAQPTPKEPGLLSKLGAFLSSPKGQQVVSGLGGISQSLANQRIQGMQGIRPSLAGGIGSIGRGFAGGVEQAKARQAQERQQALENAIKLRGAGGTGKTQVIDEATGKIDKQGRELFQKKLIDSVSGETIRELGTPAPKTRAFATPEQTKRIKQAERQGALGAERQNKIQTAASGAVNKLTTFNELDRQLDKAEAAGFETGALAGAEITGKRLAQGIAGLFGFNIDFEGIEYAEAIRSIGNTLAQQARAGTGEGTALAGQMSDKDVEFLKASMPGLDKTIAGNRLLIDIQRRLAQRQIDYAELATAYEAEHGILDAGFNSFAFAQLGDVFDDEFITRTESTQSGQGVGQFDGVSTEDLIKAAGN
jgi:hypothetical protein